MSSAAIQQSIQTSVYFLFAAAAIAINSSAGRTQPDADAAASGAGTTGASIGAGAGLPAKADVAAIANAVAKVIYYLFCGETCLFRGTRSFAGPMNSGYIKLMSVYNHFV